MLKSVPFHQYMRLTNPLHKLDVLLESISVLYSTDNEADYTGKSFVKTRCKEKMRDEEWLGSDSLQITLIVVCSNYCNEQLTFGLQWLLPRFCTKLFLRYGSEKT